MKVAADDVLCAGQKEERMACSGPSVACLYCLEGNPFLATPPIAAQFTASPMLRNFASRPHNLSKPHLPRRIRPLSSLPNFTSNHRDSSSPNSQPQQLSDAEWDIHTCA
jgi:hypothetical protein